MAKKLADDLIQTNTEYTKLRAGRPDGETPRETPGHQAPGGRGLDRPDYAQWTTAELREAARRLGLGDAETLDRHALIAQLVQRQDRR